MLPIEDTKGVSHYISLDHVISITENDQSWTVNMAFGQRHYVDSQTVADIVAAIGMADPHYMDGDDYGTEAGEYEP